MLDKLKDIVPEVNENKANLIYQKSIKPKFRFNYQLVLRFALVIIVLVPVFLFAGLGGSSDTKTNLENNDAENSSPGMNKPNDEAVGDAATDKLEYFRSEFKDGFLKLYFYDYYAVYYIKEIEGYNIVSVTVDGEEIIPNKSVYCVNSSVNITIVFDLENIKDKILFSISIDNKTFDDHLVYTK